MKIAKRVAAWIGIIIILALFVAALILSFSKDPASQRLFSLCVYGLIVIPVVLYGYFKLYDYVTKRKN